MSQSDRQVRSILSNYSEDASILHFSKIEIIAFLTPGVLLWALALYKLPPGLAFPGKICAVLLALTGLAVLQATPKDESAFEMFGNIVRHYTQQPMLLHATTDSNVEQPERDGILGKIGQSSLFNDLPYVGGDEDVTRTQDQMPVKRIYQDTHAILTDDGDLLAAIEVTPANMTMSSAEEWDSRVQQLSEVLTSSSNGKAQWFNPMRAVDYQSRQSKYAEAAKAFRRDANRQHPKNEMSDVLADLCVERSGVVYRYQETTYVREYYVLIKVEPKETVFEDVEESGGLGKVPLAGKLLTKRELKKRSGTDAEVEELLDTLDRRVSSMLSALSSITGINASRISSVQYAQVIADYYAAANAYANADFKSLLRQAPLPGSLADPEYDVSYRHISNQLSETALVSDDPLNPQADGGVAAASPPQDAETGAQDDSDGPLTPDAEMGIATTKDELTELTKNVLAPESFDRGDADYAVLDDELYTKTLAVVSWPSNPSNGLLNLVQNYSKPGLDVTISTHMERYERGKAEAAISELVDILEDKVKQAKNHESKWWFPKYLITQLEKQHHEAQGILNSLVETDDALFEANVYITIRAPNEALLETAVSDLKKRIRDAGANAKSLKHNHDRGFETTAPLVDDKINEPTKMLSRGLAAMFSWTSNNLFEPGGIAFGIHQERNESLIYDFWSRGTGFSLGIFGKVGSGKTTTLTRILTRLRLLSDWRGLLDPSQSEMLMVTIDPLQEFAGLCDLFDGDRIVIGGETNINIMYYEEISDEKQAIVGESTPQRDAARRTLSIIQDYYAMAGIPFGESEKRGTWELAIRRAYRQGGSGMDSPTLQDVFDIIRNMIDTPEEYVDKADDVASLEDRKEKARNILNNDIEAFKEDGEYYNLTQPTNIDFSETHHLYLDLQNYENETKAGGLYMQILLNMIYEQAKSRDGRTVVAIDEAHYLVDNSETLESLKQIMMHHRHYDMSLIFSTQEIGEFFGGDGSLTSTGQKIFNNLATRIYHFSEELQKHPEWGESLQLKTRELNFIETADTGEALVQLDKEGTFPITVDMDDELNPREFAMNQFDPNDHGEDLREYLRGYRDDRGRDVCEWSWTDSYTRPTGVGDEGGEE